MDARTFAESFELLAELPNGVQKLREMILRLAVKGKLMRQDPEDEPASNWLHAVSARKRELIREDKLRGERAPRPVGAEDKPYDLPAGWAWARLGAITEKLGAGSTPLGGKRVYQDTGIKFLRSQNVWNSGLRLDDVAYVPDEIHERMSGTVVRPGDVLLNITGASIGRCAVVPDDFDEGNVSQHVAIVRLVDKTMRRFLHTALISPFLQDTVMSVQVGISREGLSMTRLREFPIPVPPLREQHRIVAKVDELMAPCDELEAAQKKKRQTRVRLNGAALHKLTTATAPADFAHHWQRVRDHFDLLYDTPETVDELRQAVLQLAVRGKLVRQDPSDEPAEVLLGRIAEERERLSREGKLRKPKAAPVTDATELPHALPRGWTWARFGDVATIASDLVTPQKHPDLPHIAPDNIEKGTGRLLPYRTVVEDDVRSPNHRFHAGQIIYSKIRPNLSKAVLVDFDGLCSADMYPVVSHISVDYLLRYILSPTFLNMAVKNDTRVAMPKINQTTLNAILVAVPPLDEQHRIVAKVEELMALCDELEAKLNQARTDGERLMEAVVARLVEPAHVA